MKKSLHRGCRLHCLRIYSLLHVLQYLHPDNQSRLNRHIPSLASSRLSPPAAAAPPPSISSRFPIVFFYPVHSLFRVSSFFFLGIGLKERQTRAKKMFVVFDSIFDIFQCIQDVLVSNPFSVLFRLRRGSVWLRAGSPVVTPPATLTAALPAPSLAPAHSSLSPIQH